MEFNPEFNPMVLLTSAKEESDSKQEPKLEQNWGPILAFVIPVMTIFVLSIIAYIISHFRQRRRMRSAYEEI